MNKIVIFFLFVIMSPLIAIELDEITIKKGSTIKLIAPLGVNDNILGVGFDNEFNNLNVKAFNGKKITTKTASYSSDYKLIDNYTELNANAKLFTFFRANYQEIENERYIILSIYYIDKTISFIPEGTPKVNADFYASKLHYGWSLNYLLKGKSSIVNKGIGVEFGDLLSNGGSIQKITSKYQLEESLQLQGLETKEEGVTIATKPAETLNKFKKLESVPILIEYESIKDVNTKGISWEPEKISSGDYVLDSIKYTVAGKKNGGKEWDMGFGNFVQPDVMLELYVDNIKKIYFYRLFKFIIRKD